MSGPAWDALVARVEAMESRESARLTAATYPAAARRNDADIKRRIDGLGRFWITVPLDLYDPEGTAAAAITTHEAAADPHPGYLTLVEGTQNFEQLQITISVVTANTGLVAHKAYVFDSAGGALNGTLPASPAEGDQIDVRRAGANTVTILRNGKNIDGAAADLLLAADGDIAKLIYDADSASWWKF